MSLNYFESKIEKKVWNKPVWGKWLRLIVKRRGGCAMVWGDFVSVEPQKFNIIEEHVH